MRGLRARRAIRDDQIAAAMLAVPREAFLNPGVPVAEAYADGPVLLKRDRGGAIISTISQPTMIATMLEQLAVRPGDHVLEIGTASGYNAALLGELAGPDGLVVSVELEADLAANAARALKRIGMTNVHVICADGRAGWAAGSPYDGIIVTAGAERLQPEWESQLREGGRLVVPVAPVALCFGYEKQDGGLVQKSSAPAGFVPLRSAPDAGR